MRAGIALFILGASLLLGCAVGSPQVPNQPLAGATDIATTSLRLPKLFSDLSDGGASAASAIPPRNRPVNGRVATLTLPGAAEQPAIKLVSINTQVLANKPRRMALDMPGSTTLVITRRADLTTTTPVAAAASGASTPGPLTTQWVGEVVGAKGPASSAVLLTSEDGGLYGKITYIDRQTNVWRTFTVSPLIEEGVDEAAVAGAPNITAASVASLYPKIDTSRHVVMEVIEPNYKALLRASHHVLEGPKDATVTAAAAPNMIDTTPEVLPGHAAAHTPVQPPHDAQALAEAMAASAGNTTTATAAEYLAAAESWMQARAAGSSARVTAAAVPSIPDTTSTPPTAEGVDDAGRKLLQSTNSVHDMLAVYTPAAAAAVGGEVNMQMAIRGAVVELNKIYADSRVPITVNIVGIRLLPNYVETTGNAIQEDARTGRIPNLHTWRNQTGADFVVSFTRVDCGLGWVDAGSEWQYAQLGVGCLSGTALAHEIGHLGGCGHNARFDVAPKPYAFGFSRCDRGQQNFNTLLGNGCGMFGASPEGVEIPLFANPSLTWAGMPAGDATNAHCVRALVESRVRIAGYRNSVTPAPPTGTVTSGLSATMCITAPNTNLGTQVTLQTCSSTNNNQRLQLTADGSLQIANTNRCLDVRNAGVDILTAVQVWDCNGTPAQQWFYDQWRRLHPYHSPDKCLETAGTTNGALLSLGLCSPASLPGLTPNNAQVWSSTTPELLPQMPVIQDTRIRSLLNNALCLDVFAFNYTNRAPILTWNCNDLNNQKWQFGPGGLIRSTHNTAKCLVVEPAGGSNNGATITIFDCNTAFADGTRNQRWFVDRSFRLRPYNAPNKCVDIMSANMAPGGRVQLWDCVPQSQQIWTTLK